MRVLLTGSNGQVGWEIRKLAKESTCDIISFSHHELDIVDAQAVSDAIALHKPDFVINSAAYTAVDKAESEQAQCLAVNRDGANNIAHACQQAHIPLLHYSTDYVFNGDSHKQPFQENSPTSALNVYGRSKLEGELAIRQILPQHLILRICGVFGEHGHNFIKSMIKAASQHEVLRVVNDQYVTPTPAYDIAKASFTILRAIHNGQTNVWGTYHYTGKPALTWFEYAKFCIDLARPYCDLRVKEIKPVTSAEYAAAANRPAQPILDCHKINTTFAIEQPNWQARVKEMIQKLYQDKPT